MTGEHHCVELFDRWIRGGMTGCRFAASAAGNARVSYVHQLDELAPSDVAQLEGFIDNAATQESFAITVFPRVRTSNGIVRLLQILATGSRWRLTRVPWRKHARVGASLVGLQYRTTSGDDSSVMGFAPLGCMPVTRRAPYVAVALWAGEKLNPYKRSPTGAVGFIDAAARDNNDALLDAQAHQSLWDGTMGRVKTLLNDPAEDGFWLKDVAFCLPARCVDALFPAA